MARKMVVGRYTGADREGKRLAAFDLRIFSAGALRIGITNCVEAFSPGAARAVDLRFATSLVMRAEVEAGTCAADILISPAPVQAAFAAAGHTVPGSAIRLGAIRAGVVVHRDAPDPDIATAEALSRSLSAAERIVDNVASSGQYIERMLDRLGLAAALAGKVERVATGAAVMETIAARPDIKTIGFGQSTEIKRLAHLGIRMAGPLPGDLDELTRFDAALRTGAAAPELARTFVGFLAGTEAKALLRQTGIV